MLIVLSAFIGTTFALQLDRFSSITRSQMNADWSIFIVWATRSLVICYLIIVFILPKSLILYAFESAAFNLSRFFIVFEASGKSFI